jgi:hypothetical protein
MRLPLVLGVALSSLWCGDSMARTVQEEPDQDLVVFVCSRGFEDGSTQGDSRETLETYVSTLDDLTESQLLDIESLVPSEVVRSLRENFYEWRLGRDAYCWEIGRSSTNDLAELECLASFTESYFDQAEIEISRLEARQNRFEH